MPGRTWDAGQAPMPSSVEMSASFVERDSLREISLCGSRLRVNAAGILTREILLVLTMKNSGPHERRVSRLPALSYRDMPARTSTKIIYSNICIVMSRHFCWFRCNCVVQVEDFLFIYFLVWLTSRGENPCPGQHFVEFLLTKNSDSVKSTRFPN